MCRNTMRLPSLPFQGLRVFLLCLAALLSCCEAAIQCSPAVNDVSHVPNIPASLSELGSTFTTQSNGNVIFLYPVSSLSCSGTVTGMEFCYHRVSSTGTTFTLLIFSRSGNVLSVDTEIPIPTPSQQECLGMTCCGTYTFTNEQFELPQGDFHLGVQTPTSGNRIIGFHSSLTVQASYVVVADALGSNSMLNFNQLPQADSVLLRIMRLIVDSSPATIPTTQPPDPTTQPPVPTTQPPDPTTQPPDPTTQPPDPTTQPPDPTTQPTTGTTDPMQTTDSPMTPETTDPTDGTVTTPSSPTNTGATSAPQTADDGLVPTVVGVQIGLLVAVVLLIVSVVLIVMCLRKNRKRNWGPKHMVDSDGNLNANRQDGFDNAVYNSNTGNAALESSIKETAITFPNAMYDYASPGQPAATTKASSPDMHEYATADELTALTKSENPYEYANTLPDTVAPLPPRTFAGGSQSKVTRGSITDAIYMAPARDENSLYAQFTEIKIKTLTRATVSLKEKLGSGQFGTVHKAEWKTGATTSQLVAVKTLNKKADAMDKVKFLQEAAIMGQFKHPNVVKLHGVVTEDEPIMIVLELLLAGDLRNHLIESRGANSPSIDAHTLLSYCRQIASGMTYLSSKAFVHRDLAARNILMSEDGVCKIADFGMSRDLMDETYYISHGGKVPVRWTAPEALHYKKYSTASDVWSFGCVMYEIWSLGHKPFEAFSNNQTICEVDEGYRMAPPPGTPRSVYKLMIECWHPLKAERPTFIELMQGFSLPDTMLLKWSDEDKAVHPQASVLGAQLNNTENLFLDLQESYITTTENVGSYEVPVPCN